MASHRTATVKELVKLWNSGDMDRFLESLAPDFEFAPDPSFPDAGVYGGDEMRGWMRDWAETWQDNELEILGSAEHGRRSSLTAAGIWRRRRAAMRSQ